MLFSFDLKTVKILLDLILTSYNIREKPACLLLYKLIVLKVSFVVHSTIHLQKMPLVELSGFCIRYFSKTKCKPAKKITGQCFPTEVKATCTHSANLERETEITKIVTYPLFPLAFSFGDDCKSLIYK